jgi:hypothetical protein
MSSHWRHWTTERGVRAESPPTRRLTVSLFDVFLRHLVPSALRELALASWADRFQRLAPLDHRDSVGLAHRVEQVRMLAPVMTDVMAARRQHLFFASFLRALEELGPEGGEYDWVYADSGAWSMACRRLLTILEPPDVMRAAFQAAIDDDPRASRVAL